MFSEIQAQPTVRGRDFLLHFLQQHAIQTLFGVPSAQLDPLYNPRPSQLRLVLARHETAAGYMAEGAARLSKRPGVVFSSGGPGCAQLLPAVMSAAAEQKPLLVITGDHLTSHADQGGFQAGGWADQSMLASYCKAQLRIETPTDWLQLRQLWAQCQRLPQGPVHLQVPFDSWFFKVPQFDGWQTDARSTAADGPKSAPLDLTPWLAAPRVAMLVGGSVPPEAAPALQAWLKSHQLPVAITLDAKGMLPEDHPLCAGIFGYGGSHRASALILQNLDALLILGVTLNERNTLNQHPDFWRKTQILTLGCTRPPGLTQRVQQALPMPELPALLASLKPADTPPSDLRKAWLKSSLQAPHPASDTLSTLARPSAQPHLLAWIEALQASWPEQYPLFVDAGQVRPAMGAGWIAQYPGQIQMANQLGAMGWALGAGIGACADSQKPVGIVLGDGSLLMYGLELSVAVQYQLPVCCFVSDNQSWGSVQQRLSADNPAASFAPMNWSLLAQSLGLQVFSPQEPAGLAESLENFFGQARPSLIVLPTPVAYEAPEGQELTSWLGHYLSTTQQAVR